jgi:hypothetical protein
MHTDTVISKFVIWNSLRPLSYYNGFQRTKIGKRAPAGMKRHITFTIPDTLEIIRKPGSATSQCVIMAAYNKGLLNMYGIKKHNEKITRKKSGQQRYRLINRILTNPTSLQLWLPD